MFCIITWHGTSSFVLWITCSRYRQSPSNKFSEGAKMITKPFFHPQSSSVMVYHCSNSKCKLILWTEVIVFFCEFSRKLCLPCWGFWWYFLMYIFQIPAMHSCRFSEYTLKNWFISDGASATGANAVKLLKVAWMTFPLGVLVTLGACLFVFWWQDLSYSSPYAHAILINGKLSIHVHTLEI